jgi:hypothetical protein
MYESVLHIRQSRDQQTFCVYNIHRHFLGMQTDQVRLISRLLTRNDQACISGRPQNDFVFYAATTELHRFKCLFLFCKPIGIIIFIKGCILSGNLLNSLMYRFKIAITICFYLQTFWDTPRISMDTEIQIFFRKSV